MSQRQSHEPRLSSPKLICVVVYYTDVFRLADLRLLYGKILGCILIFLGLRFKV